MESVVIGDPISDRPASSREAVIRGAWLTFRERGPRKASIAEIARCAGVSRGTVYLHFPDKEAIFKATSEEAAGAFFGALAGEMARSDSLVEQVDRLAVFICEAKDQRAAWGEAFDAEWVALLLTTNSDVLLARGIEFLVPYLEAAAVRGEVRADLDAPAAAEWLVRILFSMFTTPSPRVDLDDPDTARSFVRSFATQGLGVHS